MTTLALVVLARNDAAGIARCLDSVRGLVDKMVVVDTGSDDATVAIARAAGADVHSIAWTGDMAATRNAALALADADWHLMLDADESLEVPAGMDLRAELGAEPFIGMLPVATSSDIDGRSHVSTTWQARLLPRGVALAGAVDERPVGSMARRRLALTIHHQGDSAAALAAKQAHRFPLRQQALAAAPDDPYLLYQLGKHVETDGDYAAALEYYRQALALCGPDAPFRLDLVVRSMYTMKMTGLHEEAIGLADAEMANWPESPDYYFALGDLLLDWATLNPATAMDELMPMVEASWLRCLELGERIDHDGAVSGRGSHLAAHNLAVMYDNLGMPEKAAEFHALAGTSA